MATFLTYLFQSLDSDKKRKWVLIDKETDNKQKIKLERIEKIEELGTEIYISTTEIMSLISHFANNEIGPQEVSNKIAFVKNKMQYLYAMAEVLSDDELNNLLRTFIECEGKFNESIFNVLRMKNDANQINSELNNVGSFYSKVHDPFTRIIKKLDKIKIIVLSINN